MIIVIYRMLTQNNINDLNINYERKVVFKITALKVQPA